MWTLQSIPHPHFPLYTFPPFTCFPFTRFPFTCFPFTPFPLFCTLHIILLSLLLYHEEYHSLPFTNHHFPLYMSLHILLLIMRCEFRFGNLQEENQCKFKSNDPNAIESVNISPELRSLAQPMLHEHFLVICMDVVRMSFCTLTLRIFVFARRRSTPAQTSLNRILWFSDHYPYHLRN